MPRYTLYPTMLSVPVSQERSTVWEDAATPVPVNCATVGELVALLRNPALPDAVPEALGVNWIVTWRICPAGIVTGRFNPRMSNSELVDWSEEMVTAAFEAVSVACRLAFDPTVTLPKLRVEGLTPNCGSPELASPTPVTNMESWASLAVLTSSKEPWLYALAVGVKMMGNSMLAPGLRLTGTWNLPNEKPCPCSDSEVIRSVLFPVFESCME